MRVINAARTGRFMFGNGAQWYIVDESGQKVMLDTVNGTTTFCPEYTASQPRMNEELARGLEEWLMAVDTEPGYSTFIPRWSAMDAVRYAVRNNNLLFTNGGQWYIEQGGTVVSYELGVNAPESARYAYSIHGAWKYMRAIGTERTKISEETRKFLSI